MMYRMKPDHVLVSTEAIAKKHGEFTVHMCWTSLDCKQISKQPLDVVPSFRSGGCGARQEGFESDWATGSVPVTRTTLCHTMPQPQVTICSLRLCHIGDKGGPGGSPKGRGFL